MILLAVIGLLAVVVVFLSLEKSGRAAGNPKKDAGKARVPCPLCGSRLIQGERIRSVAFDLGREKLMHIYGCPFCERLGADVRRRCPVCKESIPPGGFAVGRMWDKPEKRHLHIVGCTACKPQYKTNEREKSP